MRQKPRTYSLRRIALATLLGSSGAALAASGQWVVVSAAGSDLKPGALVDGKKTLKLSAGAEVTLLSEDGKTLKLTGPYASAPGTGGGSGKGDLQVIAKLLTGHQQGSTQVGALRGGPDSSASDAINTDGTGRLTFCATGATIVLTRRQADADESVVVADARGEPLTTLNWPAGQAELSASSEYFQDGQSHQIQRESKTITVQLYKAPSSVDDVTSKVAWMADKGCKAQALNILQNL